ncbi:hypothetical protein SPRG_02501 [Saprolegnia parasitica CBS 223.65]|uniref:Uncharacterized protein n=1 Tax=Saprolegnia parasitica (strain CBS 223.65) TaxID=695850 RepID=A0A067CQN7_SAPPC|nr:hypothetical protein SPRG_02501 [Saprolegnia parasitica CBS 223.65]KDO32808.1 hypothetical protein SPRG_02501 [Saprolegnia parasitica CBS 223.65]|eukprot:XP_012196464.1 hypothetical protein SPRG_02501 [Saprolegnia parasitica CBS 223.65]
MADAFNAIETAVLERRHDAIAKLVSSIDVDEYSYRVPGKTLLHLAVAINDAVSTSLFLRHGARVHCLDNDDATPLHLAPSGEIALLLLVHGASVHSKRLDGATPLHRTTAGNTPLHFTSSPETAATLLSHGALVDAVNVHGHTPLHLASSFGRWSVLLVLLEHGASTDLKDNEGRTGAMIAACVAATFQQAAAQAAADDPLAKDMIRTVATLSYWEKKRHEGRSAHHILCDLAWQCLRPVCKDPRAAFQRTKLPTDVLDVIVAQYVGPWAIHV